MTATASTEVLALIVLLPLLGAMVNGLIGARLPKSIVTLVATGSVLGAFLLSVGAVSELMDLRARSGDGGAMLITNLWSWIESGPLTVAAAFMLDPLSAVMLLIVTGVGFLIHVFSVGYMHSDKAYWRYFAYLNLFMFSMLLLILGKNILVLFVGWEGVGLCSYLLIGFWYDDMAKAQAGQKAFVTNRVGDFSFLLGVFTLLFFSGGDLDFVRLRDVVGPGGALQDPLTITIICLLLFGGATPASRRSSRSTSGCPTPWLARRRSRRSSTPPPW
jgi:NADH-quinone oxidoreductase subunit L